MRLFRLTVAGLVALVVWLVLSASVFAQEPIEPCVVAQPEPDRVDFSLSTVLTPADGWYVVSGGGFASDHAYAQSGVFSRTVDLPEAYNAMRVTVIFAVADGRTGLINVTLGDAQEGGTGTFGSGLHTASFLLAQGVRRSNVLRASVQSNSTANFYSLEIEPVSAISKTNQAFVDPNGDGIDYPSWFISSTNVISVGSRSVGGALGLSPNAIHCTPVQVNTAGTLSPTMTISFTASAGGNRSVDVSGQVVSSLTEFDLADNGNRVGIANGSGSYTLTVPIYGSGYLCLTTYGFGGSTGGVDIDNVSATSCEGDRGCATIRDPQFSLDYQTIYSTTPLAGPPGVDGEYSWLKPVKPPDPDPVFYLEPPITNSLAVLDNETTISTKINESAAHDVYSVTILAQASTPFSLPLRVALAATSEAVGELNHYHGQTTLPTTTLTYVTAWITPTGQSSDTFGAWTGQITNTVSAEITDIPQLALYAPDIASGQWIEIAWVCVQGVDIFGENDVTEGDCIAPENGEFVDNSAWSFFHGGVWNADEQNALLPVEAQGVVSQSVTLPVLPDGYWILSFEARTKYKGGSAYVSLDGPEFTDSMTFTLGTYWNTYEIDASAYQEASWGLYFANLPVTNYNPSTSDIFIDGVCIKWRTTAPAPTPAPSGPPQITPVATITLTIDITCDELGQVLSDTIGFDFVALEAATLPTDWTDLGGWFYWLASRLWLYVAKPIICTLLFLWNILATLLQTIVNFFILNVINPILENVFNPALLWIYAIYALLLAFVKDPWGTLTGIATTIRTILVAIWDEYIWPKIEPWVKLLLGIWEDYVWPVLAPWLQPVIDVILAAWEWVKNTLWPFLQDLYNDPIGTLSALISSALQYLIDWALYLFQPVWDWLQWVWWLLTRFIFILGLILWPLWWAWDFMRTIIQGVMAAITGASAVPPLELGNYAEGFNFINDLLSTTPLGVVVLIINAILWFTLIRWSIGQFSNMNT